MKNDKVIMNYDLERVWEEDEWLTGKSYTEGQMHKHSSLL